jgi:hypothetical protein
VLWDVRCLVEFIGSGWGRMQNTTRSSANNALDRTVKHRGRTVLAMDCVLAGAEEAPWSAAQLGR